MQVSGSPSLTPSKYLLWVGPSHKENLRAALTFKQSDNCIDSGDHIAAHADRHGPGQDDSSTTFTFVNQSDIVKET